MPSTKQFFIIPAESKQYATAEEASAYLASITAEARSKNLVVQGAAFRPSLPRIDLVPLDDKPATKRDKDSDDAATAKVREFIRTHPGVHPAKALMASLGLYGPQVSAAKKQLLKEGVATDPGKGKIAAKVADTAAQS